MRGHYVAIATLGIGQIVGFTLLNWESLTRGPMGIPKIPALSLFGVPIVPPGDFYWLALVGARGSGRRCCSWQLQRSHLGRELAGDPRGRDGRATVSIRR